MGHHAWRHRLAVAQVGSSFEVQQHHPTFLLLGEATDSHQIELLNDLNLLDLVGCRYLETVSLFRFVDNRAKMEPQSLIFLYQHHNTFGWALSTIIEPLNGPLVLPPWNCELLSYQSISILSCVTYWLELHHLVLQVENQVT